jgi:putative membrane protein
VTGVYALTSIEAMKLPWTPVSLVGVAVAFFVGFKNNASYGRLWEARQIWGGIVNTSRSWGMAARDLVDADPAVHRELVYRHLAWLTALRYQLRADRSWEHAGAADRALRAATRERTIPLTDALQGLVSAEEIARATGRTNAAAQLMAHQSGRLRQLRAAGHLDDFRHVALQRLLDDLVAEQGRSERIKNFPFPRQYASFTLYTVWFLVVALPFALLDVFSGHGLLLYVLCPPTSAIISWVFFTAELIGDYSENPFEGLWNDVPISALARNIEIDLREMLGETDVPRPDQPEGRGLLM